MLRRLRRLAPDEPNDFNLSTSQQIIGTFDRVGAGIGSLPEGVRIDDVLVPQTLDDYLDALFAAPVEFRSLSTVPIGAGTAIYSRPRNSLGCPNARTRQRRSRRPVTR